MTATPVSFTPPSAGGGLGAQLLAAVVGGLATPTVALVRTLLLQPLTLGPGVAAGWSITRDIAGALLLIALLYGVLRAQLGPFVGLAGPPPWALLPRLALAAVGVVTSLPLARGLLAANNALCAALLAAVPSGSAGAIRPLAGGLALVALPAGLGLGPEAVAVVVLVGMAALACFYVVRAAEIVLLTLLLPVAAALWVVPAAEGLYRTIAGHLLVAVFVQALQVLVLLVFSLGMGVGAPAGSAGWAWAIGALALLFRCRSLLESAVAAGSRWAPEPSVLLRAATPVVTGWVGPPGRIGGMLRPDGRLPNP